MRLHRRGRFWQTAEDNGRRNNRMGQGKLCVAAGGRVVAGLGRSDTAIAQYLEICAHRCGCIDADAFGGDTVTPYAAMDGS